MEPHQGNSSQLLSELATPTRLRTGKRRLRKNKLTQSSTWQGNDAEEMSPAQEHRQGSSHSEFRAAGRICGSLPGFWGWGWVCPGRGIGKGTPSPGRWESANPGNAAPWSTKLPHTAASTRPGENERSRRKFEAERRRGEIDGK